MKIAMTSVYVHDPSEAHRFYTEVLGFVSFMHMPEMRLAIVVSVEDPQGTALLLEPNENPIASEYQRGLYDAGLPTIVLGVQDLNAEHARLAARGVSFRQLPTQTPWGHQAIFDDTCGNWIQIHQPLTPN